MKCFFAVNCFGVVTTTIALILSAATGCVQAGESCQKLAWPETPLTGPALEACVQRVLEEQLTGGKTFDSWTRARTRDVIVDRQLTQFSPLLQKIASMDVSESYPDHETAVSDALHALTLLRDSSAAALNVRHVDASATPTLLTAVIGNLTFLRDFTAADEIEHLTAAAPIDYVHVILLGQVFQHLTEANHHSPGLCVRRHEISRALSDACPSPCRSVYALTRERLETYAAANCATSTESPKPTRAQR